MSRITGLVGAALLLLALLACGRGSKATPTATSAAVQAAAMPPPAPAPSASAAPDPTEGLLLSSAAAFEGDRLVACIDVAMAREPLEKVFNDAADGGKLDAGATPQSLLDEDTQGFIDGYDTVIGSLLNKAHGKGTAKALRPRGKPTAIGKQCRQQFAARTILASCSFSAHVQPDAGPQWRLGAEIIHFDALGDDAAMKGCLSSKGNWEELPKDSDEFRHERREQMIRRLMKESPE